MTLFTRIESYLLILLLVPGVESCAGDSMAASVKFTEKYCLDCHSGSADEADCRLDELRFELQSADVFKRWVAVHDRVQQGEMPPADADQQDRAERESFVADLSDALVTQNLATQSRVGRVQYRRLNRIEYENTLRDLLALPSLEVSEMLPPDASAEGFDNVGAALNLSYVQMSRYLEAASVAIDKAMLLVPRPQTQTTRLQARSNGRFSQVLRKGEEAVAVGDAVGLLRQPNTAQAPWWWSKFNPAIDGYYRVRMKTFGFLWEKGKVLPADRTRHDSPNSTAGRQPPGRATHSGQRAEGDRQRHDDIAGNSRRVGA